MKDKSDDTKSRGNHNLPYGIYTRAQVKNLIIVLLRTVR